MKKCLLVLLAIITMQTAHAQTEKGKMLVGGSLSFRGNSSESVDSLNLSNSNNNSLSIDPKLGYFISDNFALGIGVHFGTTSSNTDRTNNNVKSNSKSNSQSIGFSVFSKNYFELATNLKFFILSELQYVKNKDEYESNPLINNTDNSYFVLLSPGFVYFINSNFALEAKFANLYFESRNSTYTNISSVENKTKNYGLDLSTSSFSIGVNYHF